MGVVLTVVQTKQIRINVHKRNNTERRTNSTKHSKYKFTNWPNAGRFKYSPINACGYSSAIGAGNVSYPDTE